MFNGHRKYVFVSPHVLAAHNTQTNSFGNLNLDCACGYILSVTMSAELQYLSALDDTDDRPLNGTATVGTVPTSASQLINEVPLL